MPYNNTPLPPPTSATGSTPLPLARVKKILSQDPDIAQTSNTAAFAIAVATEIFIRYLTDQAYTVVKSERKPRRNVAYKDIATAVERVDNLEFLGDVVPKTRRWGEWKGENSEGGRLREVGVQRPKAQGSRPETSNGAKEGEEPINGEATNGQRSIESMLVDREAPKTNGVNGHHVESVPHSPMADRTVGHGHPVRDEDILMTG
jgi:hypothetical protein